MKPEERSLHGLTRALLNNMVVSVSTGFEKRLTLVSVGYRAAMSGNKLSLTVGKISSSRDGSRQRPQGRVPQPNIIVIWY